jgi:hypothetical protein
MHEINAKLLGLFAAENALFTPIRDWSENRQVSGVMERRVEFRKRGMPIVSNGGDGATRAAVHAEANALERSGAVKYVRASGKRVAWKLSQDEYLRIAFWSLLDGLDATELAMKGIQGNWAAGAVINPLKGSPWAMVAESTLSGCDSVTDEALRSKLIMRVEEMLLPAMAFGWVRA